MRLSRQLEEAFKVKSPYEMHVATGMPLSPTFMTKGRKAAEAKGPRLFLSRDERGWQLDAKFKGRKAVRRVIEKKKEAYKLARKVVGQLRDYGDDFVVNNGKRSWRVQAGDTLAFAAAQKAVHDFFR